MELFTQTGIYNIKELEARNDVKWETYSTKVLIEARMVARMAINHILPAGVEYQRRLLKNLDLIRQNFPDNWQEMAATQTGLIRECSALLADMKARTDQLNALREEAEALDNAYEKAVAAEKAASAISLLRQSIDKLEELTDNDLWPLPKYRELLFIN